jgi:hypothetical protein
MCQMCITNILVVNLLTTHVESLCFHWFQLHSRLARMQAYTVINDVFLLMEIEHRYILICIFNMHIYYSAYYSYYTVLY